MAQGRSLTVCTSLKSRTGTEFTLSSSTLIQTKTARLQVSILLMATLRPPCLRAYTERLG